MVTQLSSNNHSRKATNDDHTRAFNYFMIGQTTPTSKDLSPNKAQLEEKTSLEKKFEKDLSFGSKASDVLSQRITLEKANRQPDFYYKLLSLNDKIQLYTQIFYSRSPRYKQSLSSTGANMKSFNNTKWGQEQMRQPSLDPNPFTKRNSSIKKKVSFSGPQNLDLLMDSWRNDAQELSSGNSIKKKDSTSNLKLYNVSKPNFNSRQNEGITKNMTADYINYSRQLQQELSKDLCVENEDNFMIKKQERYRKLRNDSNIRKCVKKSEYQLDVKSKLLFDRKSNAKVIIDRCQPEQESKSSVSQATMATNKTQLYSISKLRLSKILNQQSLKEKELQALLSKSELMVQSMDYRLNEIIKKRSDEDILGKLLRKKERTRNSKEKVMKFSTENATNYLPSIQSVYTKTFQQPNTSYTKSKIPKVILKTNEQGNIMPLEGTNQTLLNQRQQIQLSQGEEAQCDNKYISKTARMKDQINIIDKEFLKRIKGKRYITKKNQSDFQVLLKMAKDVYSSTK